MLVRAAIVAGLLVTTSVAIDRSSGVQAVPALQPLATIPTSIDGWSGRDLPAWDESVVKVLGADEYVNRRYLREGTAVADLYVGYYGSQKQGDAIHSPQNCLPGSGWEPVSEERVNLTVPGPGTIRVNRYVVQKDLDKQVVLYWYQGRGRVIASEYTNRAYLIFDSLRLRRNDGALVRVMSPVLTTTDAAAKEAAAFAASVFPRLAQVIP
jgi:EpsI family protein